MAQSNGFGCMFVVELFVIVKGVTKPPALVIPLCVAWDCGYC
jgi:hypothetical protein